MIETKYLPLLRQYVALQTVSLPGHQQPDQVLKCVAFLTDLLESGGITTEIWNEEGLNPIIFGSYVKDPSLPTVLVYGHYDVVAPNGTWTKTQPFKLHQEGDYIYGRGSTDNKGQNLIHILTVLDLIEKDELAFNVKFFVEGNEETGSKNIDKVIIAYKEKLACDHIMVSDGAIVGQTPVIELSLRGLVNIIVTVQTATTDLHSGLAGGAAHNSAVEAAVLIASMYDQYRLVKIPGFNYFVPADLIHSEEVHFNNQALSGKVDLLELFGVKELKLSKNPFTAIGLMPTIEVMGFSSGGGENGFKNIIPGQTKFGLNCRLVGKQKPGDMIQRVQDYLREQTPAHVDLSFEVMGQSSPVMLEISPLHKGKLFEYLTAAYGEKPLDKYVGGGIPVVGYFKEILGVDAFLIPFANDDCNMHAPDESIRFSLVEKAFAFSRLFFSKGLN